MIRRTTVLFHPATGHERNYKFFWIPYSLLSLAAPLHNEGFAVKIIDNNIHQERDFTKILNRYLDGSCICVGISSMIGNQIRDGLNFARQVREYNPTIPIVWGGAMPSTIPLVAIKNQYVDVVVRGQGQLTLREVVHAIVKGDSLRNIQGVIYKKNGEIKINPERPIIDLNLFPSYPFNLIDCKHYIRDDLDINTRTLNYVSSQGCIYQCGFCCERSIYKRRWTALNSLRLFNEIRYLVTKYDLNGIKFYDADFAIDLGRVKDFCELLIKSQLRVKWGASINVRELLLMKKKGILSLAEKSGCKRVLIGAESGVQEELNFIKKTIKVEEIVKAVHILNEYDIIPSLTLMVGFPSFPEENIRKTLSFGERLKDINPKVEIKVHFYAPYPGTDLWFTALKYGFTPPTNLEEWANYDYYLAQTPWVDKNYEKIVSEFNKRHCPYVSGSY